MTAGHDFSAGLALDHSAQLWKYPLSPPPGLMLGWFPSSYFSIPRRGREGAPWGVGLRKEEAGGVRVTDGYLVSGCGRRGLIASSAASPWEGFVEILPTPPTAASCPPWLPAQNPARRSQMGLCVPETKNTLLTPNLGQGLSALPQPWPQKG